MTLNKKLIAYPFLCICLVAIFSMTAFASSDQTAYDKLSDNQGGLMSIAYRGDTSEYPANSLEAIESAIDFGADMVSVSVQMTSDGVLFLCEDDTLNHIFDTELLDASTLTFDQIEDLKLLDATAAASKYDLATLEDAIKEVGDGILIIDNSWEFKDEIYALISQMDKFENVMLRTYEEADVINEWTSSLEEDVMVIGVYDSFVVFTMMSHLNDLTDAGQFAVQYESANYFSMMYTNLFTKNYSLDDNARAIAVAYDLEKSGQRPDSTRGWDELISLGYSIIETDNIEQLCLYIEQTEQVADDINELMLTSFDIDTSLYSDASVSNFEYAIKTANALGKNACLDELQDARSMLISGINDLVFSTKTDTQTGALNITVSKVIAVLVMGGIIVGAQIYVHKRQDKKTKKN